MDEKDQFKVIIVGGSVAGLTLAHCLQRAGIEHVVLEKSAELSPQVGASIGILPNGARILDQLGLYDAVDDVTEPLSTAYISYPDGFSFRSSYPRIIKERFGYPIAFLDRQKFLEILHTSYPKSSNIHTSHRVTNIRRAKSRIEVVTDAGTTFTGDLVVGADGVHSIVRSEMWKLDSRLVSSREKNSMTVDYACVFGISSAVPGLETGDQVNAFYDGLTIVTIHGKNGRVFWFVIQKLDRTYTYPDTVRFSNADADRLCQKIANFPLIKDITFGHVWERKEVVSMTALEENIFNTWHCDRVVCLGDSIHKMTPNIGQGANTAIEDAAVLTNLIHDSLQKKGQRRLSDRAMEQLLQEFQSIRFGRVKPIYRDSRFLVRFQARDGLLNTLFGRYYAPYAGDLPADMASKIIANGPRISFLANPQRTGAGWIKYRTRDRRFRSAWALGLFLVVVSYIFHRYNFTFQYFASNSLVSTQIE